jgi:hypothetical protein
MKPYEFCFRLLLVYKLQPYIYRYIYVLVMIVIVNIFLIVMMILIVLWLCEYRPKLLIYFRIQIDR